MNAKRHSAVIVRPGLASLVALQVFLPLATGTLSAFAPTPARADRKTLYKETPPPKIDLARTRPLAQPFPEGTFDLLLPQGEPKLGRNFDLMVCARASAKGAPLDKTLVPKLTMKALMPEHAHGMLVVPVRNAGKVADASCVMWKGLRFHMPGWWRVEFSLPEGDLRYAFHFDVKHGS